MSVWLLYSCLCSRPSVGLRCTKRMGEPLLCCPHGCTPTYPIPHFLLRCGVPTTHRIPHSNFLRLKSRTSLHPPHRYILNTAYRWERLLVRAVVIVSAFPLVLLRFLFFLIGFVPLLPLVFLVLLGLLLDLIADLTSGLFAGL